KLTESGYRVFFSRITLEDKLGLEYEPYIFAALNSAKVMLVFGTDYEHFNAVWVKNEWSRFLKLMAADKTKYLIPCYKDIDAYDMPEEFAHLQAQDMGKVGAEQDLIRGIKKLLPKEEPKKEAVQQTVQAGPSVANYLKLGDLALEDGDWDKAKSFFDQALAVDAECADAYLGHALAAHNVKNRASIAELGFETGLPEFKNDRDFAKFLRFAADDAKKAVDELMAKAGEKAKNNADRLKPLIKTAARIKDRFAFDYRTAAALKTDGTVLAAGNGPYLNKAAEWKNVAAIALNDGAPFAYRADGTWVCSEKYMSLPDWQDVISIATGDRCYLALRADGKVMASKYNGTLTYAGQLDVEDWNDIVAVVLTNIEHSVGLKSDGTVITAGGNNYRECNVGSWRNIAAIAAGGWHTVGLKADGTVVAAGDNSYGQCNVKGWKNIISIDAQTNRTFGVTENGKVLIAGEEDEDLSDAVSSWTDVVAVKACGDNVFGIKSDGTVAAYCENKEICRSLKNWKLFGRFSTVEEELRAFADSTEQLRSEAAERADRARKENEARWKSARERIVPMQQFISAGTTTVGLTADGTVLVAKYTGDLIEYNGLNGAYGWKDIVAASVGTYHVVGLKADGTVIATNYTGKQIWYRGQCDVSGWRSIVAVSAGSDHTVGLKADGTVVATKYTGDQEYYHGQCEVEGWKDIAAVSAGDYHTVGLKTDGTVVAVGENNDGRCNVGGWKDIVAVSAGYRHTVGLKADGTVVAVGNNTSGQCNVTDWKDIVAVCVGNVHTVGLKADGTVVTVGSNIYGQCEVGGWKDIVAVCAEDFHTVGLKADGTVVAVGNNATGACAVSRWKLFNSMDAIVQAYKELHPGSEEEKELRKQQLSAALAAAQQKKTAAENELKTLKGLFAGKRRKELEAEIASAQRTITEAAAKLNRLG
ncbi:MAG: TIR domain-containing protein, partial [Clostridia bacterium]|nr:TIR domain-containing protein [Clostridia bacterium]